jgi:hypothetical protein
MVRRVAVTVLTVLWPIEALAVVLDVTVTATRLNSGGFVEFKAESDERGEKATGRLTTRGVTRRRWDMSRPTSPTHVLAAAREARNGTSSTDGNPAPLLSVR